MSPERRPQRPDDCTAADGKRPRPLARDGATRIAKAASSRRVTKPSGDYRPVGSFRGVQLVEDRRNPAMGMAVPRSLRGRAL